MGERIASGGGALLGTGAGALVGTGAGAAAVVGSLAAQPLGAASALPGSATSTPAAQYLALPGDGTNAAPAEIRFELAAGSTPGEGAAQPARSRFSRLLPAAPDPRDTAPAATGDEPGFDTLVSGSEAAPATGAPGAGPDDRGEVRLAMSLPVVEPGSTVSPGDSGSPEASGGTVADRRPVSWYDRTSGNVTLYGPGDALPNLGPGDISIAVLGDSFISGEGAHPLTYRRVPSFASPSIIDPAHQSSRAPALDAVQQIADQYPDSRLHVKFVAVSGATTEEAKAPTVPGTRFAQPAQLDAVKNADVVVLGFGGNDLGFAGIATDAITPDWFQDEDAADARIRAKVTEVSSPAFRAKLADFYAEVAEKAPPGAHIIVPNYPDMLPADPPEDPDHNTWSLDALNRTDRYRNLQAIQAGLNAAIAEAAQIAAERTGKDFLSVDFTDALAGHELGSEQRWINDPVWTGGNERLHPNPEGQKAMGGLLADPLADAVTTVELQQKAPPGTVVQRPGLSQPESLPPFGSSLPAVGGEAWSDPSTAPDPTDASQDLTGSGPDDSSFGSLPDGISVGSAPDDLGPASDLPSSLTGTVSDDPSGSRSGDSSFGWFDDTSSGHAPVTDAPDGGSAFDGSASGTGGEGLTGGTPDGISVGSAPDGLGSTSDLPSSVTGTVSDSPSDSMSGDPSFGDPSGDGGFSSSGDSSGDGGFSSSSGGTDSDF